MLDPLTAISLASSIVQFTDFGIKLLTRAIKIYESNDGLSTELADQERQMTRIRELADMLIIPMELKEIHRTLTNDERELRRLASACKDLAAEVIVVIDGLKLHKAAGSGRKWESFRKSVASQTPWAREKLVTLIARLRSVQESMFQQIQVMMR